MQKASRPRRMAFRENYLAAISVVALMLCSLFSSAQVFQKNTQFGVGYARLDGGDSVFYFPTGCGVPSGIASLHSYGFGNGEKKRKAAIFADTCGHKVYWFDWTDSLWVQFGAGSGGSGSADSLKHLFVDTGALAHNNYVLAFDSTNRKWKLIVQSGGTPFDSSASQGGDFHTRLYNDTRYLKRADSTTSYVTLKRLADSLAALRASTDTTIFRSPGTGQQPYNVATVAGVTAITIIKHRDSLDHKSVLAADSVIVDYVQAHDTLSANAVASQYRLDTTRTRINNDLVGKMNNYGGAPGQLQGTYAALPVATGYPTGTTYIAQDSGFHYVDTGSGGSRGWKKISGGGSSVAQIQSDYTQSNSSLVDFIKNKPTLGTAAAKNIPASGDASATEVVYGTDSRLTDQRTPLNASVTNAKMATMAAHTYKGNPTGSTATPTDANGTQVTADLNVFTPSLQGVVPPSGGATGTKFIRDDGLWSQITGVAFRFNVRDSGAVGDGATVDSAAINKCIRAANAVGSGASVVFPSGLYYTPGALQPITGAISLIGINAGINCGPGTYIVFKIQHDSTKISGFKIFGNGTNQTGIDVNGFKYLDFTGNDFVSMNRGIRLANTSATYNAGNMYDNNFYNCNIGFFSDTLGEYITIFGGLVKGCAVGIQNDGGNNSYIGLNVNFNTTGFKFTGGSNNSHGIIANCNINHNSTNIDANGANFGETITATHIYEGAMSINQCSNWLFSGGSTISPSILTITNSAHISFVGCNSFSTYGTTRNFSGNLTKPVFENNVGDVAGSITTPNPSYTPLVDSAGGRAYRFLCTSDTVNLGIARWQNKILVANDTIKKIINPTKNRTYYFEVIGNGFSMVFLDNTKVLGTFNPAATMNLYTISVIDDGADPRMYVTVTQPGVLVSRPTTNLGWGRLTGTGSISNANITKSGPDALSFTVQAVPDKVLSYHDGYYSCQAISTYGNIIFGLSTNPVQNTYVSMNFAIYFFGSSGGANNINVAETGTLISTGLGGASWATNDSFRIYVDPNDSVRYQKYATGTWNTFFTSTHKATTYPLIPQVSIRALTTFTNPRLIGVGVTNNLQTSDAVGYADNINATQPSSGSGTIIRISPLDSLAKDAKGIQVSGVSLVPQSADGSFAGLVTTAAQTIAGAKTFSAAPLFTSVTTGTSNYAFVVIDSTTGLIKRVAPAIANLYAANGNTKSASGDTILQGGAYNQPTLIGGGGQDLSHGTTGSHLNSYKVYADNAPTINDVPIVTEQRFVATADKTVANSTTYTTLVPTGTGSTTAAANTLTVGKTIHIKGFFVFGTKASGTVQPTWYYWTVNGSGSGTPVTMTNSLSGVPIYYEAEVTIRTTGSSGTLGGHARFYDGLGANITWNNITGSINTTVSNTFAPYLQWDSADPNNTIVTKFMEAVIK